MKQLIEKIRNNQPSQISDFFALHQSLRQELTRVPATDGKKIKIAVLSSFTARGFEETLFVKCCELGVVPEFYVGNYNQYYQEIADARSGLYQFNPDLVIIFIDTQSLLGDYFFLPYTLSDDARRQWAEDKIKELESLVVVLKERLTAKIIFHNFEIPHYSPLGILENKQDFGLIESVEKINSDLRDRYKKDSQVFIFDFNSFCAAVGKANLIEPKLYYLADLKVDLKLIPKLCDAYLSYIKPLVFNIKKCIVVDLDNTLWGGVVGEDGIEGIKIGPYPEGRPFLEFQKHLLSLFHRGIILAVNSKNNLPDVQKVFREHPDMILREEHFAAMAVNWNDKVFNLKAIAQEINIGVDSMVFLDDDQLNREMIKSELPEVLVVDLPADPALYAKTLTEMNDFNYLQLTEEDREKGRMYAQQRQRSEFQTTATDITSYLRGLQMTIEIEGINDLNLSRLAQLTQKTNQFNLTTRRYTEENLKKIKADGGLIFAVRVKDKFGDNGITGAMIIGCGQKDWSIDTFLLSCRVIGRKVEEIILGHILALARRAGVLVLTGQFIPTAKNAPAKDFYKNNDFTLVETVDGAETWRRSVSDEYSVPDYIQVIVK